MILQVTTTEQSHVIDKNVIIQNNSEYTIFITTDTESGDDIRGWFKLAAKTEVLLFGKEEQLTLKVKCLNDWPDSNLTVLNIGY